MEDVQASMVAVEIRFHDSVHCVGVTYVVDNDMVPVIESLVEDAADSPIQQEGTVLGPGDDCDGAHGQDLSRIGSFVVWAV